MPRAPRHVTIVGGGIAGLTLAASLDPRLFDVTLLEAQPGRRWTGAALGLWPSSRAVLDRIGVLAALGPGGGDAVASGLHDLAGRRLLTLRGPDLRLVERPRLMDALTDALPTTVRVEAREVTDPSALGGDLVIGADGVRSRVRALVHPPATDRVETPYVTLRGLATRSDEGAYGEYWGVAGLFGLAPLDDERDYWFTAHRSTLGPEPLALDVVLAEARDRFAEASPVIRRHLELAAPDTIATRLWVTAPMPRYVRGRHVVLGDAAHASLPNLGRGACDAMLDAATLAVTLNRGTSLATWQARRLPPTQAARTTAGLLMQAALADRGSRVRDAALAALGRLT